MVQSPSWGVVGMSLTTSSKAARSMSGSRRFSLASALRHRNERATADVLVDMILHTCIMYVQKRWHQERSKMFFNRMHLSKYVFAIPVVLAALACSISFLSTILRHGQQIKGRRHVGERT